MDQNIKVLYSLNKCEGNKHDYCPTIDQKDMHCIPITNYFHMSMHMSYLRDSISPCYVSQFCLSNGLNSKSKMKVNLNFLLLLFIVQKQLKINYLTNLSFK